MKRTTIYILLELVSIMFLIFGCILVFGSDSNVSDTFFSKIHEIFHDYKLLLVNKLPFLPQDTEFLGILPLSLGFILMAANKFYLRPSE